MLALDLGFSSHAHFTQAFRREFGCAPSQLHPRRFVSSALNFAKNDGNPRAN
jgi:AraC-like DNA-binding protein